jgi:hypothetical protein
MKQLREKIVKWEYMKLKGFCTAKETVTRLKRQQIREWVEIFAREIIIEFIWISKN